MDEKGSEGNGSKNKKDYTHVWSAISEVKRWAVYLARSEGGTVLVSIVNDKRENVALYALGSNENLAIAATAELKLKTFINVHNKQERRKQRLIKWKERAFDGQF